MTVWGISLSTSFEAVTMQICAACTSVVKRMVTRRTTEPGLVAHDDNPSTQAKKHGSVG